jgi:hypothetical protein
MDIILYCWNSEPIEKLNPNLFVHKQGFFPERKIPGNPEIPEVFPARKSLISDIIGFPDGDQDHS